VPSVLPSLQNYKFTLPKYDINSIRLAGPEVCKTGFKITAKEFIDFICCKDSFSVEDFKCVAVAQSERQVVLLHIVKPC
jgi:hypothetical protein